MMVAALSAYQMPATSFYVELVTMLEGLPCWLSRKEAAAMQELQETQVGSLGGEGPLEEGMATHSSILAWRPPKDGGA